MRSESLTFFDSPRVFPTCRITHGFPNALAKSRHFPQGGSIAYLPPPRLTIATSVLIRRSPSETMLPIAEYSAHIPTVAVLASTQSPKKHLPVVVRSPADTPEMSEWRFWSKILVFLTRILSLSLRSIRFMTDALWCRRRQHKGCLRHRMLSLSSNPPDH